MDYTKDAILVHEGIKSLEKTSEDTRNGFDEASSSSSSTHHQQQSLGTFSIFTLMNSSEYIEKKMMTHETDVMLMKGNGSLLSSSPSPGPSMFPFDDPDGNDTMDYIPMSMRPETYIVPVIFAIIFIIGVIGNGTLIVIFIKHRSMRNVPNMFIVSLAIGDLLVILFCVPFTSTVYTVDSWPYGLMVCKFSEFIKDLSVGVSVFTLTALSADRYFAIVDPMRKLTGRRATRITIISIVGIWILSILVALPSALYSYIRVFPEYEEGEEIDEEDDGRTFQVCYPYPTEFGKTYAKVMVMFHFLVYYAVPLLFIATFYIIMARHLVLSTRNMPGEAQGQAKQIQARKKVAKMILSFVVIFAICFFPHHLFLLWFYFYPDSENSFNSFWNICRILGFCLSFTNSCINPITLYCVSGTFRKQFNEHLFCCICDEHGNRPSRGGRLSGGGTLLGGGGGGGRSGGGVGLCAACVSLSGNNGQLYGNDSRYGNGSGGRGGNGRMHRGSTSNSDRLMSKRKSTHWETQTTVVNHRVLNPGGAPGVGANIHVNLCSEHHHEHIPMKNMTTTGSPSPHHHHQSGSVAEENEETNLGETEMCAAHLECHHHHDSVQCGHHQQHRHNHHHHHHDTSALPTTALLSNQGHGRRSSSGNNRKSKQRRSHPNVNKANISPSENSTGEHPLQGQQQLGVIAASTNLRSNCIREETSGELENSSKSSQQHSSPTKSLTKVGEIFSKISSKCNGSSSPIHHQTKYFESSSPSKKSPTKVAPTTTSFSSSSFVSNEIEQQQQHDDEAEMNYNNNNYTENMKQSPESTEECTLTTFITVP